MSESDRAAGGSSRANNSAEAVISAARLRAELEGGGQSIEALDTLIAGQALAHDWTLVTKDLKDFLRVEGLTIIDLTHSDQPFDRPDVAAQMLQARPKEDK